MRWLRGRDLEPRIYPDEPLPPVPYTPSLTEWLAVVNPPDGGDTAAPVVTLWLTVKRSPDVYGRGEMYTRDLPTWHAPTGKGHDVVLWVDQGGESWPEGHTWPVSRAWWGFDGRCHVQLVGMRVDPSENLAGWINRHPEQPEEAWWTAGDGDPEPQLLAAGWRVHRRSDEDGSDE